MVFKKVPGRPAYPAGKLYIYYRKKQVISDNQ